MADCGARLINVVNVPNENGVEGGDSPSIFYASRRRTRARELLRHSGIDKNSVVTREGKIPKESMSSFESNEPDGLSVVA